MQMQLAPMQFGDIAKHHTTTTASHSAMIFATRWLLSDANALAVVVAEKQNSRSEFEKRIREANSRKKQIRETNSRSSTLTSERANGRARHLHTDIRRDP